MTMASNASRECAKEVLSRTFGSLIDLLPDIQIFAKDMRGRFLFVNQNFADKCGKASADQLVGLTDLEIWPRFLGKKYRQDDEKILLAGKTRVEVVELISTCRTGSEWHATTKIPILGRGGEVLGVAGFTRELKRNAGKPERSRGLEGVRASLIEDYARPLDMEKLAILACLSVSQLERRFKAAFNTTPRNYLIGLRLHAACQAIAGGDEQFSKIARDCGFYDQSHLNHIFKREMGMSPRQYRQENLHARWADPADAPELVTARSA